MRPWRRGSLLLNRRFSRKPEVLILGLALLAGGCLLGPNFKTPPAPVADTWVEDGNKAVDAGLSEHRDWWAVFNDPVLTRLVDTAYQQNLTLRAAGVRVLEARAQLGVAIGEFYPQQQLASAAVTYNGLPISFPFNIASNTYWEAAFGAQAGWETISGASCAVSSNRPTPRFWLRSPITMPCRLR